MFKSTLKRLILLATQSSLTRKLLFKIKELIPATCHIINTIPIPNKLKPFLIIAGERLIFSSPERCTFSRQIYWNQGAILPIEDKMALEIYLRIASLCSTTFDIGCNSCQFSISACSANAGLEAYAFDLLPEAITIARKNVLINNISTARFHLENIGISDTCGTKLVPLSKYSPSLMTAFAIDTYTQTSLKELTRKDITTLDNYMNGFDVESLTGMSLFKIDVEGFEHRVLRGAEDTIQKLMPTMICEVRDKSSPKEIQEFLSRHDYAYFIITDTGISFSRDIYIHDKFRDWLFIPKRCEENLKALTKVIGLKESLERSHFIEFRLIGS